MAIINNLISNMCVKQQTEVFDSLNFVENLPNELPSASVSGPVNSLLSLPVASTHFDVPSSDVT